MLKLYRIMNYTCYQLYYKLINYELEYYRDLGSSDGNQLLRNKELMKEYFRNIEIKLKDLPIYYINDLTNLEYLQLKDAEDVKIV